jgi:hypothetical protein
LAYFSALSVVVCKFANFLKEGEHLTRRKNATSRIHIVPSKLTLRIRKIDHSFGSATLKRSPKFEK